MTLKDFKNYPSSKKTYGILGHDDNAVLEKLHNILLSFHGDAGNFIKFDISENEIEEFITLSKSKLHGLIICKPYKNKINVDFIPDEIRYLNQFNILAFKHKQALGYNTDILGFKDSLDRKNINLEGKNVLILSCGNISTTMAYYCKENGANLYVCGRNNQKLQPFAKKYSAKIVNSRKIPDDIDIIINGSSAQNTTPLHYIPKNASFIFDCNYCPMKSNLIKKALYKKINNDDGVYMLLMQAIYSQKVWNNYTFTEKQINLAYQKITAYIAAKRLSGKNIVLCGFMGSGKTTISRKLSKLTGLPVYDIDSMIEQKINMPISEFFAKNGEEAFRKIEHETVRSLEKLENIIISTGGGSLINEKNVVSLKKNGILFHINAPLSQILINTSRNITKRPLLNTPNREEVAKKLYDARYDMYKNNCDFSLYGKNIANIAINILKNI